MAYSKLPKVCIDYGLGFDDFNQACDNADAMFDLYDVRHGTGEPNNLNNPSDDNPWLRFGKHDDPLVARTLTRVQVDTSTTVPQATIAVQGVGITAVERLATGQFSVRFVGGVGFWRSLVQVEASSSATRGVTCYEGGGALFLTTWELSGGTFSAADMDFCVFVWGSGA